MNNNNSFLSKARQNKKDEFYTQLSDVENELKHYVGHFEDKVVYCNCDIPGISNFYHYFKDNFKKLKLKKLITSCYEKGICSEYTGNSENTFILQGDGDFRSSECIEFLKQADVIVTNPPFSLFKEYVDQLIEHDKKFLIIGNQNVIKYKNIFPLFRDNKMWFGYGFKGSATYFINEHYENYGTGGTHKDKMIRVSGVQWFTNLEIPKRKEILLLHKSYTPDEYPRYDNFDAIEVSKVKDIPVDYKGVMGVPITFLAKYNPDQFEIIGVTNKDCPLERRKYTAEDASDFKSLNVSDAILKIGNKYKTIYIRIFIKWKM